MTQTETRALWPEFTGSVKETESAIMVEFLTYVKKKKDVGYDVHPVRYSFAIPNTMFRRTGKYDIADTFDRFVKLVVKNIDKLPDETTS